MRKYTINQDELDKVEQSAIVLVPCSSVGTRNLYQDQAGKFTLEILYVSLIGFPLHIITDG